MRAPVKWLSALGFVLFCGGLRAQSTGTTLSGKLSNNKSPVPFAQIILVKKEDSLVKQSVLGGEDGRFSFTGLGAGNYWLRVKALGYVPYEQTVFIGSLSSFQDLRTILLQTETSNLGEVIVSSSANADRGKMEKKVFSVADNLAQSGGSVLQALQNLPGITVQEGKINLRGSEKVAVLIDGKQTALTGFGSPTGLDNLPASAIDKIEIINNPSAKFDANGNAGIINIVLKKTKQQGWSGKYGLAAGVGSLWVRKENLPGIRPQYQFTPKINPSFSLNYRKKDLNFFFQADNLYTQTLNKNEFVSRYYDDGTVVHQQLKRNRNTNFFTLRSGLDWAIQPKDNLTLSLLYGTEKIIDRGDQPFFNGDYSKRLRLWQFLEDELKTTVMASAAYQHQYPEAGRLLNVGFNYTFHREDEKYFFDNYLPSYTGKDAFKLLSDEQVADLNIDYAQPLQQGRIETGLKFRKRDIPTNMQFFPGLNSPLDSNAGGPATYREIIPAIYGNYVFENQWYEAELGLRLEYVDLKYEVNPQHNTYKSDGYQYFQPFPSLRLAYKINAQEKLSFFYNRRVDRPNEVDIRVFPKYDDAEIIKVGNPALKPQFTQSLELGYRKKWQKSTLYLAAYHRIADATITRIAITVPGSNLVYAIFQNAGRSYNSGMEMTFGQEAHQWYGFNINANLYRNQINAFTVNNLYPKPNVFSADQQEQISGNVKWNNQFHLPKKWEGQVSLVYLAPDIIPQGKIKSRFAVDAGAKKSIEKGRGELFFNATDLFNTLVIRKEVQGQGFRYTSVDYAETQVLRVGYSRKF